MKKLILFTLVCLGICSDLKAQEEKHRSLEQYKSDTLYFLYTGRELQEKKIIPLKGEMFGTKQYWFYFYFEENNLSEKDFIALIKSNYMDFDHTVPAMKLIDLDWMERNKSKILDPSLFKMYDVVEVFNLLVNKTIYLIDEENLFGDKVYARQVKKFSNYRWPE